MAEPPRPGLQAQVRPARSDLAEAVLAMLIARARETGLPQPVTPCEACAVLNLDRPEPAIREQCARACGIE